MLTSLVRRGAARGLVGVQVFERGFASKAAARNSGGAQLPAKRRRANFSNEGARRSGFEAHGFEAPVEAEEEQRKAEPALARPIARRASPAAGPAARRGEPARGGAAFRPGLPAELSGTSERKAAEDIPKLDWDWVPPSNVRHEVEEQVREEELINYVAGSRTNAVSAGVGVGAGTAGASDSNGASETVAAIPRQSRRERIAEWTLKSEEHLDESGGYIVVREGEHLSPDEVVTALQAHRGHDVRHIVSARGDDVIICTATSRPHMRKLGEVIYQSLKQRGMLRPGVGKVRRGVAGDEREQQVRGSGGDARKRAILTTARQSRTCAHLVPRHSTAARREQRLDKLCERQDDHQHPDARRSQVLRPRVARGPQRARREGRGAAPGDHGGEPCGEPALLRVMPSRDSVNTPRVESACALNRSRARYRASLSPSTGC